LKKILCDIVYPLGLTTVVNKACLVANFVAEHGLLTSSKLFTKPTTISFYTLIDLKAWMSIIFGNKLDIEGVERTFDISHLLDSSPCKLETLF
jgi:hypothetical protein